jgi:hypothetical protein
MDTDSACMALSVLVFDDLVGSLVDPLAAKFVRTKAKIDLTAQSYDSITDHWTKKKN